MLKLFFDQKTVRMMAKCKHHPSYYLEKMARFARIRSDLGVDHAALAARKAYIRINGSGLRLVSLSPDNPCGAIEGHSTSKTASKLKNIDTLALNWHLPKNLKPEHRRQAALIEHALRWPDSLPDALHIADICDEIRLVTDELAINAYEGSDIAFKSIRADVILAARKADTWFPIFIELKNLRATKTLLQLDAISNAISNDERITSSFVEFMRAAAGIDQHIDISRHLKLMIWPWTSNGRPLSLEANTRAIEFDPEELLYAHYDHPTLTFTRSLETPA